MAGANKLTRFYHALELGMTATNFTVGTWAFDLTSNVVTFLKAAADNTSVVIIPIPASPNGALGEDRQVSIIKIPYVVGIADLDAAPSAVLDLVSIPATTGVAARSAIAETETFTGDDAVGIAFASGGQHVHIITVDTPVTTQTDEHLILEWTVNAAATSTVRFYGIEVTYR